MNDGKNKQMKENAMWKRNLLCQAVCGFTMCWGLSSVVRMPTQNETD